jgi:osmotically-inducible protein OsmY
MTDERRGERPEQADAPRNALERTKDEVQAWFGNANAAARRQRDQAVGDHTGKGPEDDLDPDARIMADISQRLTEDPDTDASRVKVASREGLVTLTGEVSTAAQRARAEQLAGAVAGVQLVENRLQVI